MTQYYWKDDAVAVLHGKPITRAERAKQLGVLDCYCVDNDTEFKPVSYGKWIHEQGLPGGSWKHIPYDDFPDEFKTQLKLLGVV